MPHNTVEQHHLLGLICTDGERKSETHTGSKIMKCLLAIAIIMSLGGFLTTHYQYKSIKNVQAVKMDINERLPDGWLYNLNHSTKIESPAVSAPPPVPTIPLAGGV